MELRHYYRIIRRSWPLIVGLPALIALLTVAVALVVPTPYVATAAILVTQRPFGIQEPQISLPDYNNFHSWAASEYVVDDILQIVELRRFSGDIAAWLRKEHGLALDPAAINNGLEAERRHRMVYITATAPREDQARLIMQGAVAMIRDNGLAYWNRPGSLQVSAMELPDKAVPERGLFGLLFDIALRGILALILALGLAFLRHYLDQSLHLSTDVEALGLDVVGTIPKHSVLPRVTGAHKRARRPDAA